MKAPSGLFLLLDKNLRKSDGTDESREKAYRVPAAWLPIWLWYNPTRQVTLLGFASLQVASG